VELQQFDQLHYILRDIADLKSAVVVFGIAQYGEQGAKSTTVYIFNAVQVEHDVFTFLVQVLGNFFLERLSDQDVELAYIIEGQHLYTISNFTFKHMGVFLLLVINWLF
jgi:hypothetical protein